MAILRAREDNDDNRETASLMLPFRACFPSCHSEYVLNSFHAIQPLRSAKAFMVNVKKLGSASLNVAPAVLAQVPMMAALVLLGLVLAHWTLQWFMPNVTLAAVSDSAPRVDLQGVKTLFGIYRRDSASAIPSGITINLLGVIAETEASRSYALLQVNGKETLAARAGDLIAPGITLAEVHDDRVVVDRDGTRETVVLPEKTPGRGPSPHG